MSHAECQCSCCSTEVPLIDVVALNAPAQFASWLTGTPSIVEQGPLAPQEVTASVTSPPGLQSRAYGGTVSFPHVFGDTLRIQVGAVPRGVLAEPLVVASGSLTVTWAGTNATIDSQGTFLRVTSGGQVVLAPRLQVGGVEPAEYIETQFWRTPVDPSLDDRTIQVTVSDRTSTDIATTTYGSNLDEPDLASLHQLSLTGRLVIERDGEQVADLLNPTFEQWTAATQPDGAYVETRYPNNQDFRPTFWPPQPSRVVRSFASDQTPPRIGFLPYSDVYEFLTVGTPALTVEHVVFATKPMPAAGLLQDESRPGAAARPKAGAFEDYAIQMINTASWPQAWAVGLNQSVGHGWRDQFDVQPAQFPVVNYRIHQNPAPTPIGPYARFAHPGLETREQWRARSQAEKVTTVRMSFNEPVVASDVTNSQVSLTANGVAVTGCTIAPAGASKTEFLISVPQGAQTEGAFLVLTYDPAGEVRPDTQDARPSVLACRTAWLMQKPYKQALTLTPRLATLGRHATITTAAQLPADCLPLSVGVTGALYLESTEWGGVTHRPGGDLFVPRVPEDGAVETCGYYNVGTTIFPQPPKTLRCRMPVAAQPANSVFRFGGGIAISLEFQGDSLSVLNVPGRHSPITPQLIAPNTWKIDSQLTEGEILSEQTFPYNPATNEAARIVRETIASSQVTGVLRFERRVTEYPQLETAYPWEMACLLSIEATQEIQTTHEQLGGPGVPVPPPAPRTEASSPSLQTFITEAEETAGEVTRPFSGSSVRIVF